MRTSQIIEVKDVGSARLKVLYAVRSRGEYTHNIISCSLRIIAEKLGRKVANQMIDEFKLTKKFGIQKEDDDA